MRTPIAPPAAGEPALSTRAPAHLPALLLGLLLTLAGCTEDAITGVDSDTAPGASASTEEFVLPASGLVGFRDTSFVGFALPDDAGFTLVADREGLRARALGRITGLPDSLEVPLDTLAVVGFEDVTVSIRIDTLASTFPDFPLTLRLHSLEQGFDTEEATWTLAAAGRPWVSPGGDLGVRLGSAQLTEVRDTLRMELDVSGDSLLRAWREMEGEPGFALLVEEAGTELRVQRIQFDFSARLEGREEPQSAARTAFPTTFIYDPDQPPPGSALRLAGLPAWRLYMDFRLPERVGEVPLREATINRVELIFRALELPPEPFVPDRELSLQALELLEDPFRLGPRTPVGGTVPVFITLDPELLEVGTPLVVDITEPVRRTILEAEEDEAFRSIRLGIRAQPDAQTLGFVEFASRENPDPALRPSVRFVLTPPTPFGIP